MKVDLPYRRKKEEGNVIQSDRDGVMWNIEVSKLVVNDLISIFLLL